MGFKIAAAGFVVFLFSVSVIQGQNDWGVTYTSTQICALTGSTVDIHCSFTYPSTGNDLATTITETIWFTKGSDIAPVDLTTDAEYSGRVQYHCDKNNCTLRITDLRESDSAEYKFMFITNQPDGRFTGSPGVTLSVTALQVQANKFKASVHSIHAVLYCDSTCQLPGVPSYFWYITGQSAIKGQTKEGISYENNFAYKDSFACAVRGFEDFASRPVFNYTCFVLLLHEMMDFQQLCLKASICAFKGSSVDISCTYFGNEAGLYVAYKFWFSPEHSHRWQNPSQPEDLSQDYQYAGRVQLAASGGLATLRITDLRESDSAQYRFKFRAQRFEWRSSLHGTTLTVTALQVQVTKLLVQQSFIEAELKCHSSCSPAGHLSYVWFKNGEIVRGVTYSYRGQFHPGDNICCAFKGYENYRSPSVYAPKVPSVSVSPSGEVVEGSSVTLTCSSDANPAANYTWYKENQTLTQGPEDIYLFNSVSLGDSGTYHCKSENKYGQINSTSVHIDVQYAPKLPSVSVSPSAEIVEGSSVNLTCSSDANPAANYTWYKENEDSPKASGQIFTITDIRPEHSGNYYCEAQNRRGRHNSTSHLIVVSGSLKSVAAGSITAIFLAIIFLCAVLLIRRKRSSKQTTEPGERPDNTAQLNMGSVLDNPSAAVQRNPAEEQDDLYYASVSFSKNQEDPLYSNIRPAQTNRHKNEEEEDEDEDEDEEGVEYTVVNFKSASDSSELRHQEAVEDSSALYSAVTKKPRV